MLGGSGRGRLQAATTRPGWEEPLCQRYTAAAAAANGEACTYPGWGRAVRYATRSREEEKQTARKTPLFRFNEGFVQASRPPEGATVRREVFLVFFEVAARLILAQRQRLDAARAH